MGNVHICTRLGRAARGIMSRTGSSTHGIQKGEVHKVGEMSSRHEVFAERHGKQPSAKGLLHKSADRRSYTKSNKGSSGTPQRTNRLI